MEFSIRSRRLKRTVTFSRPGSSYVFVDLNGQPGTLGQQICDGGALMGNTCTFHSDDVGAFAKFCRRWWQAHLRKSAYLYDALASHDDYCDAYDPQYIDRVEEI